MGEARRRLHPEPSAGTEDNPGKHGMGCSGGRTRKKGGGGGRDKGDKGGPVGARKMHIHTRKQKGIKITVKM